MCSMKLAYCFDNNVFKFFDNLVEALNRYKTSAKERQSQLNTTLNINFENFL